MGTPPPLISFFFLLISLVVLVNADTDLRIPPLTPINRDLYHSSDALMAQIKALVRRHPDKLNLDSFGSTSREYHAEMNVVTYCRNRTEIDDRSKLRILLSFGQHGRELITSEVAFRLLSILSEEQFLPSIDPASLNKTLDRIVVKVVPMENFNGRKIVEAGDLCDRRNGRGVDLNRNWAVDWGKKEKDYDPYEENPGVAPFSEPESQIMQKLSMSFEPHIWVNVHSGMEALFMPYDHKNTTPDGLPSRRMRLLLDYLNNRHCNNRCIVGSGGGSVGYLAHGTATDYMYDIAKVPMAFTFEIYGDMTASSKDCFKMFNPVDLPTFNRVLNDWSGAFMTMFNLSVNQIMNNRSFEGSDELLSMDDYLNGYLVGGRRSSRNGKKTEVLELGMQEIRTYFRLFLLSCVLLMFMFCSRISKNNNRQMVPNIPI
ncbi:carboxypeptidase A6-like [Impatiens glandulifera]|uniref:carboxypeptidase A6-like n=1 Tax=Impatiens glandulifera TaxID=253017 RepID=UPI001FB16730|nr:carboxypeptidase A6-like [Impatiens glandulifera]